MVPLLSPQFFLHLSLHIFVWPLSLMRCLEPESRPGTDFFPLIHDSNITKWNRFCLQNLSWIDSFSLVLCPVRTHLIACPVLCIFSLSSLWNLPWSVLLSSWLSLVAPLLLSHCTWQNVVTFLWDYSNSISLFHSDHNIPKIRDWTSFIHHYISVTPTLLLHNRCSVSA
jgi:hypothetical protein